MHAMFYYSRPCKEGRSPFLFGDEDDDDYDENDHHDGDDGDQQSSPEPSYLQIREALSRSNSELEAGEAFDELAALASQDAEAMGDGSRSKAPDGGDAPAKPASSSKVDPNAVHLLLQMVKQKMKNLW